MDLKPRLSAGGVSSQTAAGWILRIPSGSARQYRLAQLDDQQGVSRAAYPWRPPLTLSLRARASAISTPGTWGFGLWNDPYGFSFGPGSTFLRLPALPQAAWFFHASARCYLSFRDDRPGRGFMAQVFHGGRASLSLIPAAVTFPIAPRAARRMIGRIIDEDASRVDDDPTEWHHYRIRWTSSSTQFWMDDRAILNSALSPSQPLGLVAWIDNQYAAFDPQGKLGWGTEANAEDAWLEIEDMRLEAQ